jgi:hypothetical protein
MEKRGLIANKKVQNKVNVRRVARAVGSNLPYLKRSTIHY